MNKTTYLIVLLLIVAAFLAGSTAAKMKYQGQGGQGGQVGQEVKTTPQAQAPVPTQPPFNPTKSQKPEVKFFVMSFCPYGNQAEAGLEPVYQLLKDKITWSPRYIVNDKKASCEQGCPFKIFNADAQTKCDEAIKSGQVKDLETCKTYFPYQTAAECLSKECAGLKTGEFDSLHGVQELNQDVREICAYNQNDLEKWWKFVSAVNKNCTAQNADTCWTAQAQTVGLDTAKISACAGSQKSNLLLKEITEAQKYQASGSPTVFINETLYNGGRSSEDYKKAICSAFENPPEECSKVLGAESSGVNGDCEN